MAMLLVDAFLPATLTVPPMTDEQFADSALNIPICFLK